MDGNLNRWAWNDAMSPLWLWIAGTVLVYAITTNALWLGYRRGTSHLASQMGVVPPEQSLAGLPTRSRYRRWLLQVGRFLFYLVIPYLALGGWPRQPYQGLLALEDLGIVGLGGRWPVTRWLEAAGIGLGWGLLALLLLTLALCPRTGMFSNGRTPSALPSSGGGVRLRFRPRPWWVILVDVLYLEVHWAFLRGGLAVALDTRLAGHAMYAAVFLGLGLVYLEWSLNPFWRQDWRLESQAAVRWLRAALALVVAVLYLFTRNLWICLAVHWLLEFSVRRLGREQVQNVVVQARGYTGEACGYTGEARGYTGEARGYTGEAAESP